MWAGMPCSAIAFAQPVGEPGPERGEVLVGVGREHLGERGEAGRGDERVAVERPLLRGAVLDRVHDVGPAAERGRRACRRRSPWRSTRGRAARRSARSRRRRRSSRPTSPRRRSAATPCLVQQVAHALEVAGLGLARCRCSSSPARGSGRRSRSPRSSSSRCERLEVVERHDERVARRSSAGMPFDIGVDAGCVAPAHRRRRSGPPRTSPCRGDRGTSPRSSRCRRGRSRRARCGSRPSSPRCRSSRTAPARAGSAGTAPRRTRTVDLGRSPRSACPCAPARSIASTTFGCAWPTTIEPKPLWKSTYSLPSTSQTRLPLPSREVDRVRVAGLERRRRRRSGIVLAARARTAPWTPACASSSAAVSSAAISCAPCVVDHVSPIVGLAARPSSRHRLTITCLSSV